MLKSGQIWAILGQEGNFMDSNLFYLDSYVLQKDMRIRLPKAILANLPIECGETHLGVYVDRSKNEIILKVENEQDGEDITK